MTQTWFLLPRLHYFIIIISIDAGLETAPIFWESGPRPNTSSFIGKVEEKFWKVFLRNCDCDNYVTRPCHFTTDFSSHSEQNYYLLNCWAAQCGRDWCSGWLKTNSPVPQQPQSPLDTQATQSELRHYDFSFKHK